MTISRPSRRRSGAAQQAAPADVGRIAAIRDELDARSDEQRRREDTLIENYISADRQKVTIIKRRDAAIGDLERQLRILTDKAAEELATADEQRAAALAELNTHRGAEKLAIWFDLTPKKVRSLIHAHRAHHTPATPTVAASGDTRDPVRPDYTTVTPARPSPTAACYSTIPSEPVTEPGSRATAVPGPAAAPAAAKTGQPPGRSVDVGQGHTPDGTERLF